MADALCGPSNALQNFQKQTAVDRTLQQDRLVNRQTGGQGFRSSSTANAGVLDPEFDAFQAGLVPQPDFLQHQHHGPSLHMQQHMQPHPQQGPHLAGWAMDFQRMSISSPAANAQQPFRQHDPPAAAASWHQDFLQQGQQQQRIFSPPQSQSYIPNMGGGIGGYGMGGYAATGFQQHTPYMNAPSNQMSATSQGKQRAQESIPQFDDAAFEQAFQQAQADMLESQESSTQGSKLHEDSAPEASIESWRHWLSEMDATSDLSTNLSRLESLESAGFFGEHPGRGLEAQGRLKELVNTELQGEMREQYAARAETLIKAINERLMSTYPLFGPVRQQESIEVLEPALNDPIETQVRPEPLQQETKREEPLHPRNQDDEMAETAGQLLEKVAGNTSEKFQKSQFLELMRRLRDREVRVEGDKMVETNPTIPHHEQDADLGRNGVVPELGREDQAQSS
jgi:hypothetical protein